jgi:hypothetical protein
MMVFEIPATVIFSCHGKASETGISQKTCQIILIFNAFGKKSAGSWLILHLIFLFCNDYWLCKHEFIYIQLTENFIDECLTGKDNL